MKRAGVAFLLSLAAFGGALAVNATPPPKMDVNHNVVIGDGMPRMLSDYHFFVDGPAQVPAHLVTPYRLNTPLYSDGADKLRFLYLPPGTSAKANGEDLLDLPIGAALIKTFAFGEGQDRRLIETRVLIHRADGWLALPYIWDDAQTDARLAIAGGRQDIVTPAGKTISYRIPNKNQCKECHGLDGAVIPIGPKARNLSRDWLAALHQAGGLDIVPEVAADLPVWENRDSADVQSAARAYLDVNCAHCHRPGATASNSGLDLRWEQTDPKAIGIMKRPVAAGRGAGGHLFDIVPGKPDESITVYRMESLEAGVAMPELGKSTVDEDGVKVVRDWIASL